MHTTEHEQHGTKLRFCPAYLTGPRFGPLAAVDLAAREQPVQIAASRWGNVQRDHVPCSSKRHASTSSAQESKKGGGGDPAGQSVCVCELACF